MTERALVNLLLLLAAVGVTGALTWWGVWVVTAPKREFKSDIAAKIERLRLQLKVLKENEK